MSTIPGVGKKDLICWETTLGNLLKVCHCKSTIKKKIQDGQLIWEILSDWDNLNYDWEIAEINRK